MSENKDTCKHTDKGSSRTQDLYGNIVRLSVRGKALNKMMLDSIITVLDRLKTKVKCQDEQIPH